MKTFTELMKENIITIRLFNAIYRGLYKEIYESNLLFRQTNKIKGESFDNFFNHITPNDILDNYPIETIIGWRNLGRKTFEEFIALCEIKKYEGCGAALYSPMDKRFVCKKTCNYCTYDIPDILKCSAKCYEEEMWEIIDYVDYLTDICGINIDMEQREMIRNLEENKNKKILRNKDTGESKFE